MILKFSRLSVLSTFFIKETRLVDLGLQYENFTKLREFNDIYWLHLPTTLFNL
jgi:hypothetical protein